MDRLGGRKLVTTAICLIIGAVTVGIKGDVPANFLMLLQTALGAFVGGNVVEHWAKMRGAAAKAAGPPESVDLSELTTQIAALQQSVAELTELTLTAAAATKSTNDLLIDLSRKRG